MRNQFKTIIALSLILMEVPWLLALEADTRTTPLPAPATNLFDLTQVYRQVTTHPDLDLYPAVSPDGRWLAFASRRSGNMDIWVKPIQGGPAIRITTHRADDIMPCWSPDGKKLAFVSYRQDAAGDIWLQPLRVRSGKPVPAGAPQRLTVYLGQDISPAFSPDGRYIALTSDRNGRANIHLLRLADKRVTALTEDGGIMPTWSPTGDRIAYICFRNHESQQGQILCSRISFRSQPPRITATVPITAGRTNDAFPNWNPASEEIVFNRYDNDTNGDGKLTPDDRPALMKIVLPQTAGQSDNDSSCVITAGGYWQELQLIPALEYDYYPVCGRDQRIYFVSQRNGNDDIWSLPAEGLIPRLDDAFLQYQFSTNYFPLAYRDLIFRPATAAASHFRQLQERLLAFQRVNDFFPREQTWTGWAMYEIARTYIELDQPELARTYFEEILAQYPHLPELVGKTRLQLIALQFQRDAASHQPLADSLEQLIAGYQAYPAIAAEAQLLLGESLMLTQRYARALSSLEGLIAHFPDQPDKCALAQLLIGDIYGKFGQTEEVIQAFLRVIENYPHQETWVDSALNRILSLEQGDDFHSSISIFQNIIARYGSYPRLAARAQFRIGELFWRRQDAAAALAELALVAQNYPEQRIEVARAELLIAQILIQQKEERRGINQYLKVISEFSEVQGGLYVVQAKEELLAIYLETGKRLRASGEPEIAWSRFRDAVRLFPGNLEAHRNLIATMYSLGRIDEAIAMYLNRRQQQPEDEVFLYMLGLCYSYKATELSDRLRNIEYFDVAQMAKSNALIQAALSKNYRLIPAYLTLSYNYEFIEKYESALGTKKDNFLVATLKTIVAPLQTLFAWITFQPAKTPTRWFEQAIDALTTALALNDEQQEPLLESELALNLANNYYNLQEFGFERAYHFYHVKLQYDTTFANATVAAQVYKQMGHCALVVEDFVRGPSYLKRAIALYRNLGDHENWLLNVKRLALLYQLSGDYDESVEYFKIAADSDLKSKRYNQLAANYRSIAYNYQLMNDHEEALRYAQKALKLFRSGQVDVVTARPNWIKIGILGIEFPVWNLGQIGAGFSTAAGGFTTDEEIALLYSIMGEAALGQRSIADAIRYLELKLDIYRQRKDRLAEAIFLNNIGYLYYWDFDYGRAWEYFDRSFRLCKKLNNVPGTLINIINLAELGVQVNKLRNLSFPATDDSLQRALAQVAPAMLRSSMEVVVQGLAMFDNASRRFPTEHAQLYHLLGHLYFLKNLARPDSLTTDPTAIVQQQLRHLEDLAVADTCYRYALAIATAENLPSDRIFAHQNLGQVSLVLGDYSDAIAQFSAARTLAIRQNQFAWLWRIDFALGSLLSRFQPSTSDWDSSKDAAYFFEEALTSLEQSAVLSPLLRTTATYRYQVRQVYQTVIDHWIAQGRETAALRLTERLRDKQYLDFITNQKLELKKERHKIILGNARFLTQKIAELDTRIWLAREQGDRSDVEVNAWRLEKRSFEDELRKLLEEIRRDDPQLEAFIRVEPISFHRVQEILGPDAMLLNYFLSDHQLYLWAITADSVKFVPLALSRDSLQQRVQQFLADIRQQRDDGPARQWLWQHLFAGLSAELATHRQVCIIPDGVLAALPFSYLIHSEATASPVLYSITTAPSLASYFFSFQQRKIRGSRLFWASPTPNSSLESLGYTVETANFSARPSRQSLEQLRLNSQSADVIYWDLTMVPNDHDPLIARIYLGAAPKAISFPLRDLFSFDLNASLLLINGLSDFTTSSFQTLARSLVYAGAPGILVSLWPAPNQPFWNRFLKLLQDYPASEALARAQLAMKRENVPAAQFAGYQLIGFHGMTDEQEFLFAQERFAQRVAIGNQYAREGAWADALANYELALAMAKKQGQTDAIQNLQLLIIDSATNGGFYDKAISYQLEMIATAASDNDARGLLSGYFNLVELNLKNKNYDQAIKHQFEFIALAQEFGLQEETAGAYRTLGVIYEQMGDYDKARQYYSQAVSTFDQYHIPLGVAYALKDRGKLYLLKLDNYSRAIEDQEQALAIFRSHQDSLNTIEVLQNLGLSHERLTNYQTALQYQLQALALAEKLNLPEWLALARQYLANVSWKMGNYERALIYQKQALQMYDQLGNRHFQSVGYATMGLIFMSLGNLDEALKYESQAFELAQTSGSQQDLAAILKNMGLIFRAQNRFSEALTYFQRAIHIDQALGSPSGLSYGYRDIGSIYFQQGKIDSALIYFRRALAISQQIQDGRNAVHCLYEIGKTYLQLNQAAAALDTLTLAADRSEQLFIPDVEWRCRRLIGKLFWQQQKMPQSLEAYQKALAIIENMRAQIKVEEYKSGFIDDKLDVYHDVVDILLELKRPEQALEMVERAKSRNFIDLLANRDIQFGARADSLQLAQGKKLENELRRVQNEISRLLMKGNQITAPEREELARLTPQLQQLKDQYQQFLVRLKEQNSELAGMIRVEPPNIGLVQAALPDSVAIIEYFYTSDRFYVWTITNRRIAGQSQAYRSVELVAQVAALRDALQKQTSIINVSQRLHDLLLAPLAAEVASANHLVIVPHGVLHYLPFAALMDNNQRYLIERYSLSLAPSATVLQLCLQKGAAFVSAANWTAEVLAVGNPDLKNPALELPFAEKEIESIRLLYPRVVSYVAQQATETVFKASCARARTILLSCHGEFDAANPLFSALLLAADRENDGRLEAHEIFGLQMDAYLVVMSACETGLARVAAGDELIGLSRSFIYAGSSSLLSSLWKVDDLATAVMIKRFFRYLKEGQSRGRALQQSINFVREQINVHPVYWAAFNLTGDFR